MSGVVNFLKPPGMSSNGAVVFLRRLFEHKKTGHAGTLDPGASGVLPVCVGKATRISSYLMAGAKEYVAEVAFGRSTDTGDSYGSVTAVSDKTPPEAAAVREALAAFTGTVRQQTPAFSAAKHEGKKRYELARRGVQVPKAYRDVQIYETEYLHEMRPGAHLLRVACGKGTYIRTLCEDIGEKLGVPAHMSFLVRTKCAGLCLGDAYTADELIALKADIGSALLPMDGFLSDLPGITVHQDRHILFNGGTVEYAGEDTGCARIYVNDEFLGIGTVSGSRLKISTLLVDK